MAVADISVISKTYDAVLALIYPQACAVCGNSVESRCDGVVCDACWTATRLFTDEDTLCWKCGALAPAKVAADQLESIRCGQCDADSFTAARAGGLYEGALRASVVDLKRESRIARRLLHALIEAQRRPPLSGADVIIPVPLHVQRERERGHNQAASIARELAGATNLPIEESVLFRRVHTERHRAGMDAKARRQSIAGAFEVRQPKLIADRHVLLIDDVFTTGATVSECARVLKVAGASEVHVLTIARASTASA